MNNTQSHLKNLSYPCQAPTTKSLHVVPGSNYVPSVRRFYDTSVARFKAAFRESSDFHDSAKSVFNLLLILCSKKGFCDLFQVDIIKELEIAGVYITTRQLRKILRYLKENGHIRSKLRSRTTRCTENKSSIISISKFYYLPKVVHLLISVFPALSFLRVEGEFLPLSNCIKNLKIYKDITILKEKILDIDGYLATSLQKIAEKLQGVSVFHMDSSVFMPTNNESIDSLHSLSGSFVDNQGMHTNTPKKERPKTIGEIREQVRRDKEQKEADNEQDFWDRLASENF